MTGGDPGDDGDACSGFGDAIGLGAEAGADLDPVIVGPDEEPGWSLSAVVSAAVHFRP